MRKEPEEDAPDKNTFSPAALTDSLRERLFKSRTLVISGEINQRLAAQVALEHGHELRAVAALEGHLAELEQHAGLSTQILHACAAGYRRLARGRARPGPEPWITRPRTGTRAPVPGRAS